jgi:NAD(P)-dependent dehydrogenase (short-subunit alcohol dehydrogenase family)
MSKIVFITGVSSGIGQDAVRKFIYEGFTVFSTVRNEEDKRTLLKLYPDNHECCICDISIDDQLDNCMKSLHDFLNGRKLFALINNAGIVIPGPMHLISDEKFDKQLNVNLIATRKLTNRIIPCLESKNSELKPRIVFISSVSGIIASPFNGPYCVSKHALECLVDIYRRELHYLGIEVVSVQPGPIKTRIWSKALGEYDIYEGSVFQSIVQKADDIIRQSEKNALDVKRVSSILHRILISKSPKTRYLIHKTPYKLKFLSKFLPDKYLDKMIWKTLGKANSKSYRPV